MRSSYARQQSIHQYTSCNKPLVERDLKAKYRKKKKNPDLKKEQAHQ